MELLLTGKSKKHLAQIPNTGHFIHSEMLDDFIKLQKSAKNAGFDLTVASSHRDYARQLRIWNEKATGKRKLLDRDGVELSFHDLSKEEVVESILFWTAIPGCSRHHWGTEIDVYDANIIKDPTEVKLTHAEASGPLREFHDWLTERIANNESFGFYRPYEKDLGGVSPELWHLSYASLSTLYFEQFSYEVFEQQLKVSMLELNEVLQKQAAYIYQQYIINISPPPF